MAAIRQLRRVFMACRTIALALLKRPLSLLTRAFAKLLQRLAFSWSHLQASLLNKHAPSSLKASKPERPSAMIGSAINDDKYSSHSTLSGGPATPYKATQDGEIVPLEGVAYSVYPLSQGFHTDSWAISSHCNSSPSGSVNRLSITFDDPPSQHIGSEHSAGLEIEEGYVVTEEPQSSQIPCYFAHSRIKPMMPDGTQRYDPQSRSYELSTGTNTDMVEILTSPLVQPTPPQGWLEYVHPEGGRYFYHKAKRVYTDADIYSAKVLDQAIEDLGMIADFVLENGIALPEGAELVYNLWYLKDGDIQRNYYYVNHQARAVFFLDTYDAHDLCIDTPGRLRHHVEAQYWYHLNLYPHSLAVSLSLVEELRDVVLHFVGEGLTSPSASTSPYVLKDLYKILDLTTSLEKSVHSNCVGAMSLIARVMYILASSKFWNYAGEAHARLSRDQSVYGPANERRTWVFKSLSILLFLAPDIHLKTLQQLWVDQVAYKPEWEQLFKRLATEWKGYILLGSVMLNANIGFLAIQSLNINQGSSRVPAQISCYLSIAAYVGSIVLGLLLVKQTSRPLRDAGDVQQYLSNRVHPRLGLETLAILYGMPYALLQWGVAFFLAAFGFVCFQNSSGSQRIIIGSSCIPIVFLSWWVYTSWGKGGGYSESKYSHGSDDESWQNSEEKEEKAELSDGRWKFSALLKIRRYSYDSQKTTVV
ncbi:hypothetical protein BDZ97DRAFT_1734878 [Flammula alnicola]|nr:hypothetical protein BDZ97DRAFT_1734878 [Flammula alnicola]